MTLNKRQIRRVVERIVPLTQFIDARYGNMLCPFHDNKRTPSARMYSDSDGITRLFCYGACDRQFTSYDYIEQVLGEDPLKYIEDRINPDELKEIINSVKDETDLEISDNVDFINSCSIEAMGDITKYIDLVYSKRGEED